MTKHTAGLSGTQPPDMQCAALARDLDEAWATMEWQRRVLSRLKAVIARCQAECRAPLDGEITEAMHDGTRMAA